MVVCLLCVIERMIVLNRFEVAKKAINDFNSHKRGEYGIASYFETIREALEKQIEKTPIQSYYSEGDYTWECVNCEETVDEGQNYCHNCGQKLLEWD